MELEVIAMAADLLGAAPDAGLDDRRAAPRASSCAVQVARDHARTERGIAEPQLLTPTTAHPAFAKAAKYLDVEHMLRPGRRTTVGPTSTATAAAITDRTGLVVGSAPCYPYGVIDPITELAALAADARHPVPHRRLPRRLAAAVVGAARRAGATVGLPRCRA